MKPYGSVIVTGSIAYDEIMNFPGMFKDHFHPEKLHQINVSFAVSHLERQLGGTGTNISYALSAANKFLGADTPIMLVAGIGKDGKEFLRFFKKNRIDCRNVSVEQTSYTATGTVITDNHDNQIWGFYYGASQAGKKIDLATFSKTKILLIISANHPDAFLGAQKQAIKNKISYLYDPGMSLTWINDTDLKTGVLHAKYLIGNDYEIAMILKRLKLSIKDLLHKGIAVITTLGEQGVKYQEKSQITNIKYQINTKYIKAFKVKKVVDPTGAGDAWRGGFVSGLVAGWKLLDCLKLGNVIASFAIESYGTVNYKPKDEEIEKRIQQLRN